MKTVSNEEIQKQYAFMHEAAELNSGKGLRFFVRTFGCQQNEADSERIAGMCREMGYSLAESEKDADLIVVNTCAVREHAELRALSITGQFKHLKEKNPALIIAVCGCMVTQEHRANAIKNSYPYVDLLFGTGMLYRFPELLVGCLKEHRRRFMIDETEGNIAEGLPVLRESKIKAWVSIMYGCNNFCTYCVVPYVRGRERSRRREDILAEVKGLIADGCREITLLGQNVNSYGKDSGDCDFADLVSDICSLDGDFILRFMTSHPKDASRKLIDVMADSKKCAKQFHLPLQSGSARVLKAMNRRYTP
ncbi:MAG: MiaB/RimO family radical SAM methylthiotransferase, partial [Candidatus Flemingiibacterium sp.]